MLYSNFFYASPANWSLKHHKRSFLNTRRLKRIYLDNFIMLLPFLVVLKLAHNKMLFIVVLSYIDPALSSTMLQSDLSFNE